jgi:RNA polymerase sigma-70 factor (ECF subfamily)
METAKRDRNTESVEVEKSMEQALSNERRDARNRALLEPNRAWLSAYVLSAIGDPVSAEDLVQDVMLIAVKDIEKYDGSSPLGAWLRGIARNLIRAYWRTKGQVTAFSSDKIMAELDRIAFESEERECDEEYVASRIETLRDCMRLLTDRIRGLVEMKYLHNLKSVEIAARAGMQVGTVDVALCRARSQVFECVGKKLTGGALS